MTFKEVSPTEMSDQGWVLGKNGSLISKSKALGLTANNKYRGIKINSSITKVKQVNGKKSNSSKNNKLLVKDFMTQLVDNLANSDDTSGLQLEEPYNGHETMGDQSTQ